MSIILSADMSDKYKVHGGVWGDPRVNPEASVDPFSTASQFWGPMEAFSDVFHINEPLEQNQIVIGPKMPADGEAYFANIICYAKEDDADYELELIVLSSNTTYGSKVGNSLIEGIKGNGPVGGYYSKYPSIYPMDRTTFLGLINISPHTVTPASVYALQLAFVEG